MQDGIGIDDTRQDHARVAINLRWRRVTWPRSSARKTSPAATGVTWNLPIASKTSLCGSAMTRNAKACTGSSCWPSAIRRAEDFHELKITDRGVCF